jgi:hypothetical protein
MNEMDAGRDRATQVAISDAPILRSTTSTSFSPYLSMPLYASILACSMGGELK